MIIGNNESCTWPNVTSAFGTSFGNCCKYFETFRCLVHWKFLVLIPVILVCKHIICVSITLNLSVDFLTAIFSTNCLIFEEIIMCYQMLALTTVDGHYLAKACQEFCTIVSRNMIYMLKNHAECIIAT